MKTYHANFLTRDFDGTVGSKYYIFNAEGIDEASRIGKSIPSAEVGTTFKWMDLDSIVPWGSASGLDGVEGPFDIPYGELMAMAH